MFAFSCTQKSNNKSTGKNDTADVSKETNSVKSTPIVPKDTTVLHVSKDTIPEEQQITIQQDTSSITDKKNNDFVNINIYKRRKYETNHLNNKTVLKTFFPGKLIPGNNYHSDTSMRFPVWICNSCPPRKFEFYDGVMDKYEVTFPLSKNVTAVLSEKAFNDSGTRYKYMFFTTNYEDPGVGRYEGGFLGVARFKYYNSKWILLNFDPAIDFLGTWGSAPEPSKILKLGNNKQGILINNYYEMNVAQDDNFYPQFKYYKIYSLVNNKYKTVFFINNYTCERLFSSNPDSIGTLWDSKIIFSDNSDTNGFSNIKLITTGILIPRKCYKEALPDKSLLKLAKRNKSCKFRITRNYSFNGREYKMISKKVKIY